MKTSYTHSQTQDAFIDYINEYYDQYRYIFKGSPERDLLKVIAEMFAQFTGGKAIKSCLQLFQRSIESELNKGYDLKKSIKLVFHK